MIDYMFGAAVLVAIVIDIATGICKAIKTKTYSSSKMREGLWGKAGNVFLLVIAALIAIAGQEIDQFPEEFALVYLPVCIYLIVMEISSILENILALNPDLDRFKVFEIFGQRGVSNDIDVDPEYRSFVADFMDDYVDYAELDEDGKEIE